jgi:hypothetical protein
MAFLALPLHQPHERLAERQRAPPLIGRQERGLVENHQRVVVRGAVLLESVGGPVPSGAKTETAVRIAAEGRAGKDSGNGLTGICATQELDAGSTEIKGLAARPNEAVGGGEDQTGIAAAELE